MFLEVGTSPDGKNKAEKYRRKWSEKKITHANSVVKNKKKSLHKQLRLTVLLLETSSKIASEYVFGDRSNSFPETFGVRFIRNELTELLSLSSRVT